MFTHWPLVLVGPHCPRLRAVSSKHGGQNEGRCACRGGDLAVHKLPPKSVLAIRDGQGRWHANENGAQLNFSAFLCLCGHKTSSALHPEGGSPIAPTQKRFDTGPPHLATILKRCMMSPVIIGVKKPNEIINRKQRILFFGSICRQ